MCVYVCVCVCTCALVCMHMYISVPTSVYCWYVFPLPKAFRKFDEMASRYADKLRRLTKQVQEAKHSHDDELVKRRVEDYDDTLEW